MVGFMPSKFEGDVWVMNRPVRNRIKECVKLKEQNLIQGFNYIEVIPH